MDNKLSGCLVCSYAAVREDFVVNEDYEKLFHPKRQRNLKTSAESCLYNCVNLRSGIGEL